MSACELKCASADSFAQLNEALELFMKLSLSLGREGKQKTPTKHNLKVQQELSLSGAAPMSGNGQMQAHKYLTHHFLS